MTESQLAAASGPRALTAAISTALRAPRQPRSGVAAIVGAYVADTGVEVCAVFTVSGEDVELLASGGRRAALPGQLDAELAAAVRGRARGKQTRLPPSWDSLPARSWESVPLGNHAWLVILAASSPSGVPVAALREIAGPVSALAAIHVANRAAIVARNELSRAREERAMVAAGLQHDLRAPLHAVLAAAVTLRDRGDALDGETRRRLLGTVASQSQRAADLAASVLEAHADDAPVRHVVTDIADVANGVAEAAQATRGGSVTVEATPVRTVTDPVRLERGLMNLVDNALKYGGEAGPVRIHVDQRGEQVEITVADRGPGVPDDLLPSLFDAYVTGSATSGGTGLGLHSVNRLARELDGNVTYARRDDGWSRFRLVIPHHPPGDEPPNDEPAPGGAPFEEVV